MSLYFDSFANSNETITGSAGNDVFQLNISGTGVNTINTGAGNDTVLGLGRAPTEITDGSGADVYQYIVRTTGVPTTLDFTAITR
jgi:Ca2+-binding RTX toxin-like protein